MSKSRWPSWALVPNKPTVSVDVKQHFNNEEEESTQTKRKKSKGNEYPSLRQAVWFLWTLSANREEGRRIDYDENCSDNNRLHTRNSGI